MEKMVLGQEVADEVESLFFQVTQALNQPDCLLRYTIQQLSFPLCKYIMEFKGDKQELHSSCELHIIRRIKTHRLYFHKRRRQCNNMQVHMMLYVAARVAHSSGLPNSSLVVRLLSEIFSCDQSFTNLLMGAYYEPELCLAESQVQSLYSSLDEGLSAFRYFLHHTNAEKKLFIKDGFAKRMVDLPLMESCDGVQPAVYAIEAKCPKTFKMLVEHGANLDDTTEPPSAFNLFEMVRWIAPELNTPEVKLCKRIFDREHPEVLPWKEQTLMMLSRKVIRRHLNKTFQLPSGIEALPIPETLKRYLNLDYD